MNRAPQRSSIRTSGERQAQSRLTWQMLATLVVAIGVLMACAPFGTKTVINGRAPGEVVAGKDGNLWFVEGPSGSARVGRITPSGAVTEFSVSPGVAQTLAVAPDGTIWFAGGNGPGIGSLTPQGVVAGMTLLQSSAPRELAAGPDGNLWFTDTLNNAIVRVTPTGTVTSFSLPTPDADPWHIAAGPGDSLWFTEFHGGKIGRITPSGKITEYPVSNVIGPDGIAAGPDNTVWFTEISPSAPGGGAIGRVTLSGTVTLFPIAAPGGWSILGHPDAITLGADGNLWFTSLNGGLGRSTPGGQISAVTLPHLQATDGITTGLDGNLWFSADYDNQIVRVTPSGKVSLFTLPFDRYT